MKNGIIQTVFGGIFGGMTYLSFAEGSNMLKSIDLTPLLFKIPILNGKVEKKIRIVSFLLPTDIKSLGPLFKLSGIIFGIITIGYGCCAFNNLTFIVENGTGGVFNRLFKWPPSRPYEYTMASWYGK